MFFKFLESACERRKLLQKIILVNLASAFYGFFFFYLEQLMATPVYLWLFVPDCPLYALWMGVSLLLLARGARGGWLDAFNFVGAAGALKYGFWTVAVLLMYAQHYYPANGPFVYFMLLFGHVGLFLEAFLLVGKVKVKAWHVAAAVAWLGANELSDYVLFGTKPPIPAGTEQFVFLFTLASTVFFVFFAWLVFSKWKKPIVSVF
ncbi:DUF1405 domain-containing protein [Candidatus Micrarchaeota archaeon]|nr:DUF1405 domain-containing protein [Candidatus Micrarchaeota archaeon]